MARTGRFGRLPTAAPDLSSQIVSMMEQWQAAEDRNILEAWSNGGRYQGKKVTDKRILAYYRKRRDSYDKDDPEYTEWDNELWQLRFQVSNEKVMMQYKLGKVGPMAVARHLQAWAQRMPKNSSYYRSLMASSGDFIKAAKAGSASGGSAYDYAAMQAKINAQDRVIAQGDRLIFAIDRYARQHALIDGDQSVLDSEALNFWESEVMDAVLDGVVNTDEWKAVTKSVARVFPGFDAKAPTYERIRSMVEQQNRASREKIRIWKTAPSDYTYYINAEREAITSRKSSLVYLHGLDTKAKMAVLWDTWTGESSRGDGLNVSEGHSGAGNPSEFLDGDRPMLQNARKYLRYFQSHGMDEEAQAAQLLVWVGESGSSDPAVSEAALANLRASDVTTTLFGGAFASPGAALDWGNEQKRQQEMREAIIAGDAVVLPGQRDREANLISSFGGDTGPPYAIEVLPLDPTTGLPRASSDSQVIIERQLGKADGFASVGYLYNGKAVMDPITQQASGYVWDLDGRPFYGVYAGGRLRWGWVNPWEASGAALKNEGDQFTIDYGIVKPPEGGFAPTVPGLSEAVDTILGGLTTPEVLVQDDTRAQMEELAVSLPLGTEAIMNDPDLKAEAMDVLDKTSPGWRAAYLTDPQAMDDALRSNLDVWSQAAGVGQAPMVTDMRAVTQNDPQTAYASNIEQVAQGVNILTSSGLFYDSPNVAYYAGNLEASQNRQKTGWEGLMRVDAMNATAGASDVQRFGTEWGNLWTAGQVQPMAQRLISEGATPEVIEAGTFVGWEEARMANAGKAMDAFAQATGFDAETYRPGGEVTWPGVFSMASTPKEVDTGVNRVEQLLPMTPRLASMTGEVAQPDVKVPTNLQPLTGTKSNIAQSINVKMPNIGNIRTPTLSPINVEPQRFDIVPMPVPNTTRPPISVSPAPMVNRPVMDEEGRTALGGGR